MNFLEAIEKLNIVIKYQKMEMDFVYRPSVSEILSDGWGIWL